MKNLIYIFVFFFFGIISAQNADALFEKATAQYNDGNYDAAISSYEQILKEEKVSASLYYNLANAHYKLNHIAPSIYYYEKALQLNPNDADIKNNLEFAENMKIDAIEEVPKTGLANGK
ncbi:tetratricopeptide repeat protein [Mesonia maritima]|uniref:tetratricopeptide repeat protein n=1 Tax=Mesonia maritima TaxID=1793873 RepID=UPI003632C555